MRDMSYEELAQLMEDLDEFCSPNKYDKAYLDFEQYARFQRLIQLLNENMQYFSSIELGNDIRIPYEFHQVFTCFKYNSVDACDIDKAVLIELIKCNGMDDIMMCPDGIAFTFNLYKNPSK